MPETKHCRNARRELLALGMTLLKARKGAEYYTHPRLAQPVRIHQGMSDTEAGHLVENATKALGKVPKQGQRKRNAEAIRLRQANDRERAADETRRHSEEIAQLVAERDKRLAGVGAVLNDTEVRAIERRIEESERELHYWQSLMTSIPGPRADAQRPRAKHRS